MNMPSILSPSIDSVQTNLKSFLAQQKLANGLGARDRRARANLDLLNVVCTLNFEYNILDKPVYFAHPYLRLPGSAAP